MKGGYAVKQIYKYLSGINSVLRKAEKALGCISLAILFFTMITNAILRYIFSSGLNWSDEINGFLFVWFGFLAATYATSTRAHLNVTALVNAMPKVVQYILKMAMNLITIVMYLLYMTPLHKLMKTLPISNVMRLPLKYIYVILPVCFGLMIYHLAFNMVEDTVEFVEENRKGAEK